MTFKRFFVGVIFGACLLVNTGFSQESPQDQYLKIYLLIQEADKLETAGQKASARERYQVSNQRLQDLQREFPNWEPTIVKFRIKYTDDKVTKLAGAADENPSQVIAAIPDNLITTAPAAPTPAPVAPVAPTLAPSQQLNQQAPSPLDEPGMAAPSVTNDAASDILSANASLVASPEAMKSRIRDLESQLSSTRSQLETARTEAAQLRSRVQDLEQKIKIAMEGTTDEKIAMMMEENQRLKTNLASTEALIGGIEGGSSPQSIMNLKEQVDKIQGQLELAKQENTALRETNEEYRQKLADVQAQLDEATSGDQISSLQQENTVLRSIVNRQLKEQARRDIAKRLALEELTALAIDSAKLETQLDILGSPLVNLTEDEKAMLRRPTAGLVVENTGEISATMPGNEVDVADYSSRPKVPVEFKDVAEEANTLFQQGKFDEAAAKYQLIMNSYPESLYAVSNIAVVRFQQGRYPVAEEHLRRAVKLAPQDAFSHSILGIVLYQQGKFDEAVQVLSRASALDPNDPKTRNYLGIAASQKGWQEAAEQECRKAIELDPQYGDAHFNLAVIYATQKPAAKELSKRHYNRALELGVPRDSQLETLFTN